MCNLLKNPYDLSVGDLTGLEEITLNDEKVLAIGENTLESWLEKNHYNIYSSNDKDVKTYDDVLKFNLVPDYQTIYDITSSIGFTNIFLDKAVGCNIEEELYTFNNRVLPDDELAYLYKHFNCEVVFLTLSKQ